MSEPYNIQEWHTVKWVQNKAVNIQGTEAHTHAYMYTYSSTSPIKLQPKIK